MKHIFKPETFVNGTPEECELMLKALEIAGYNVVNTGICNANHIWYHGEWHNSGSNSCKTHELSQSELYEITRPEHWCVSREEITEEFKKWFYDVSNESSWSFNSRFYGYTGMATFNGYGSIPPTFNAKQIPISIWRKWFYEPWVEKQKKTEKKTEFDPSLPFEVSDDGIKWKKFGDLYIGSDLRHDFPHIVSNKSCFDNFKYIRNIQQVEVRISEIEAVQVDGRLITNFKIVDK